MAATVLVTGASQGIGRAIATLFFQQGYNVVIAARQTERLEAFAEELRRSVPGGTGQKPAVLAVPTDVTDPVRVQVLVEKALDQFGAIDVLVNNAGIYISGPVEEFSLNDWHQTIDTNLWGYIHTIHALLPHLMERRSGIIVNVGSVGGKVPIPYLAPYTTSKFAVTGLTAALHTELHPKGIHVCGVYPNLIQTSFLERAIFRGHDEADQQARRRQVEQVISVPVVEKPEDVARATWQAVQHRQEEVMVGSAQLSVGTQAIAPKLLQWVLRKTFQHRD